MGVVGCRWVYMGVDGLMAVMRGRKRAGCEYVNMRICRCVNVWMCGCEGGLNVRVSNHIQRQCDDV